MKITKTILVAEEIEVIMPYYAKDNICHWYKVISDKKMIKIFSDSDGYGSIDLTQYGIGTVFSDNYIEITEKEFNDKFYETSHNLTTNL
jgi:hypothetical protein